MVHKSEGPELSGSDIEAQFFADLYAATSGWVLAGTAVLRGIRSHNIDPSTVSPQDFPKYISTELLVHMRENYPDSPAARLVHLLSFVHSLTPDTIELTTHAVNRIGATIKGVELDIEALTAELIDNGLLVPTSRAEDGTYEIPLVLRSIARRILDQRPGHSQVKSRRAVGAVFSAALHSTYARAPLCYAEILLQSRENELWGTLAQAWADRAHELYLSQFDVVVSVFGSIPRDQALASPVLAEAQIFAEQAATVSRRLGSTDAQEVMAGITLDHTSMPGLASHFNRSDMSSYSADDLVSIAIGTMQSLRHLGEPSAALQAADRYWSLIQDKIRLGAGPTSHADARLSTQRGITALAVGDTSAASLHFRRAVLIAETTTPSTPYLLGVAYAYSALATLSNGNNGEADEFLAKFDEYTTRFLLLRRQLGYVYYLTKMVRALDELDMVSAAEFAREVPDPSGGQNTWVWATLHLATFGIMTGDARSALIRLEQVIETNRQLYVGEPLLSEPLRCAHIILQLAVGQAHGAQVALLKSNQRSVDSSLVAARFHLSTGDFSVAEELASRLFRTAELPLRTRSSARAIQAAAMFREGRIDEAHTIFLDALECCGVAGTLYPVAMLPKLIRAELVAFAEDAESWNVIARKFRSPALTGTILRERVMNLGETIPESSSNVRLSLADLRLLSLLDASLSITDIAHELGLATGTVKNKLSHLYKRIGVRNAKSAIDYAYRNGYLPVS